mmetsp:Transcript_32789/g.68774  ORF Transcript_32789/g.68774 Transcript_32789/m.68774 type:complete len:210 (-) Transcript_32789:654-1283(-)
MVMMVIRGGRVVNAAAARGFIVAPIGIIVVVVVRGGRPRLTAGNAFDVPPAVTGTRPQGRYGAGGADSAAADCTAAAVHILVTELVPNERVNFRLQSIHHLHQLVHLDLLLVHPFLSLGLFPPQEFTACLPGGFVALEGAFEALGFGMLDLESAFEVAVDGVEVDEATGLVLDEAGVLLELFDLFGDESFVDVGGVIVVVISISIMVGG